jgi:hypothetical protein
MNRRVRASKAALNSGCRMYCSRQLQSDIEFVITEKRVYALFELVNGMFSVAMQMILRELQNIIS